MLYQFPVMAVGVLYKNIGKNWMILDPNYDLEMLIFAGN